MEKITVALILVLSSMLGFAQNNNKDRILNSDGVMKDTINVVAGQEFVLPKAGKGAYNISPLIDVTNVSSQLFNKSGVFIKKLDDPFQKPHDVKERANKQKGRGLNVSFVGRYILDEPGIYVVKFVIEAIGEGRYSNIWSPQYLINVKPPTLMSANNLRDSYYLGEPNPTFNFAMSGLADKDLYSYTIVNSTDPSKVIIGEGSSVHLDTILTNENVNKVFNINMMYRGKTFEYINTEGELLSSQKKVTILEPSLDYFSYFNHQNDTLGYVSILNDRAGKFFFTCIIEIDEREIFYIPDEFEITSVDVVPQNLVKKQNDAGKAGNLYTYIIQFAYDKLQGKEALVNVKFGYKLSKDAIERTIAFKARLHK